nr:PREDICTED: uncharacterized protein LOC109040266 [Bemisia tabaci]
MAFGTLVMAVGFLLMGYREACDIVVTVDSNHITMLCHDSHCSPDSSPFVVNKGSEICIEDDHGKRVSLVVSDFVWVTKYELVYYTSDYNVTFFHACECCEDHENCEHDCNVQADAKLQAAHSVSANHFECFWNEFLNGTVSCGMFKQVTKSGSLYEVLHKTEQKGWIKFTARESSSSRETKFIVGESVYDLDLSNFNIRSNDIISITVHNVSSEAMPLQSLLRHNAELYYANSSQFDEPKEGFFGDIQIALNTNEEKHFDLSALGDCEYLESCYRNCSVPQPSMIGAFLRRKNEFEQPRAVIKNTSPSVVEVLETHKSSSATIQLGSWGGRLEQKRGKCNVEYFGSYGCMDCGDSASIVFNASNVETPGFVPFRSNCSFQRNTVICSSEPTELVMKESATVCNIRMFTLNKEFTVSVRHSTLGRIVKPREKEQQCTMMFRSYGAAFEYLVTSKIFVVTFIGIILILSICSFLYVVLASVRKSKSFYNVENEEELVRM